MQKSRTEPGLQANLTCDLRNAAGFRTPVSLMYHCISCDRPIDLNMRGTHGPVVHNFPGKRSLGPYKTFELDQVRKGKESIYSTKLFFVLSFFFLLKSTMQMYAFFSIYYKCGTLPFYQKSDW